ncbi:MAG TPA: HIT family protein [Gammaproteobacteria bacterium]|jgi:histidine triad (HIT) family protein|nr:HIT family protein [Gammaproteobacteria bacterium]MCH78507.1 HIT family protein [Gammaproteobacteria bacterium]
MGEIPMNQGQCIFCGIVTGALPAATLYEDDATLAFMDINPLADGHCLVIPKAHCEDLLTAGDDVAALVGQTTARVARAVKTALQPDGLNVFQANGVAAGQTVFHLHFHILPRFVDDHFTIQFHGNPTSNREHLATIARRIEQALP